MESEKHEINMTYDPVHGLTIIGLKCPHEKKLESIKTWVKENKYKRIVWSNWKELLEILEFSEFKEDGEL